MEEYPKIDTKTLKAILYGLIDRLEYYELMDRTPQCNNCGNIEKCGIAPQPGERVRYNCYLWTSKEEGVTI